MGQLDDMIGQKLNPSEFAKVFFDWTPYNYQKNLLNCDRKRIVAVCGRQAGKTELASIKGLHHALTNDGVVVLIVSPALRQSSILFKRMKSMVSQSASKLPELEFTQMIARETRTCMEFFNGSEIHSLPGNENVRGFTASLVIVDEAGRIPDEIFMVLTPMLATTNGTLMLVGTPTPGTSYFRDAWTDWKRMKFERFRFKTKDNPRTDPSFLSDEAKRMAAWEYEQEYEAKFVDVAKQFFPVELVDSCTFNSLKVKLAPEPGKQYYIGIDPARHGEDLTAFVVLERDGNVLTMVDIKSTQGAQLVDTVGRVIAMNQNWIFNKITVDETGVGGGVTDQLKERRLPVDGVTLSIKSKAEIFIYLQSLMQTGRIKLLKHKTLRSELTSFEVDYTSAGLMKLSVPERTGGDDFSTALALAAWGARSPLGSILFTRSRGVF